MNKLNSLLKKPIVQNLMSFFTGSIIVLLISVLTQFLLPKLLSVEDYGYYKSFTLYLGYTSLLHFGLKDGIYLKLCEKTTKINKLFPLFYSSLFYQQLAIALLFIILSIFFKQSIFILFLSLTTFFFIINTYFESYLQAYKKFNIVIKYRILKEIVFLLSIVTIFLYKEKLNYNYIIIIAFYIFSVILVFIIYNIKYTKSNKLIFPKKIEPRILKPIYKRGYGILLGNFGHQLGANIDKLFISFFFSKSDFAIYSFSGMFFMVTNVLFTSLSTVLMPYLFQIQKDKIQSNYIRENNIALIIPFFVSIFVYFFTLIINFIYTEYIESIKILILLCPAIILNGNITALQNNYLKKLVLDRSFVFVNYISIVISILFMAILFLIKAELHLYAIAASIIMTLKYTTNAHNIARKLNINVPISNWIYIFFAIFVTSILYFILN